MPSTQGMAGAAEAFFYLVEHGCVADAVDKPYQPVQLQILHCYCHLKIVYTTCENIIHNMENVKHLMSECRSGKSRKLL